MSTRHVVLFVVCLFATSLFAQTSSVGSLPSQPTIVPPSGSGPPAQGEGPEDQRPPDEIVEQPGSPGSPTNSTPDLSEDPQSLAGDSGALNLSCGRTSNRGVWNGADHLHAIGWRDQPVVLQHPERQRDVRVQDGR